MRKLLYNLTGFLVIVGCSLSVYGQNRIITGKVTGGTDNEPIEGVEVLEKGSGAGAVTDEMGRYAIAVPPSATVLEFKIVGYLTQKVSIGSGNVLNVAMQEDVVGLETAVVTALAIKKEMRSLGYATQEVKGDALESSGEANVI